MDKWIKFEDELPTNKDMEQVKIFFCDPRWATFAVGFYVHDSDDTLRERLAVYDIGVDRYFSWESAMPTHWMKCPEMPERTKKER